MTGPQSSFENYPGGPDGRRPGVPGPAPVPVMPPPKPGRRAFLLTCGVAGLVVAAVGVVGINRVDPANYDLPDDPDTDPTDTPAAGSELELAGYTVRCPARWEVETEEPNLIRLVYEANVVVLRYYEPGAKPTPWGEARRNLGRLTKDMVGGRVAVQALQVGQNARSAQAKRAGTVDGERVSALAEVVMDPEGFEALAVIWLLSDAAASSVGRELITMRDDFLGQFG